MTVTEWKTEGGGYKEATKTDYRRLPFYCCAISFLPFEDAVSAHAAVPPRPFLLPPYIIHINAIMLLSPGSLLGRARCTEGGYSARSAPWGHALISPRLKAAIRTALQACTPDGTVYDIVNIVSYIQKFKRHPVTGEPLGLKDVIALHFAKNAEGQYHCPVLHKARALRQWHPTAVLQTCVWVCHGTVRLTCTTPPCAGVHREHPHRGGAVHWQCVLL